MELDDGLDDLLAQIDEPPSPSKNVKPNLEDPGTSQEVGASKPSSSKTHCILVNQKQRGNPLLKFITGVAWEYDDILPDYEIGKTIGILFLSVRYYNTNPDYINNRLKELGKKYELRVLLVQVDLKDPHAPLKNLTRICLLTDLTLMLAWSPEEAAKVIENYKIYENKPPDRIMEKIENDPHQKNQQHTDIMLCTLTKGHHVFICWNGRDCYYSKEVVNALTSVRSVNKTDAMTLISIFGTLENIIKASEIRLAECPGFGATKAKKLYTALHQPFLKRGTNEAQKEKEFAGDICLEDVENIEKDIAGEIVEGKEDDNDPEDIKKPRVE